MKKERNQALDFLKFLFIVMIMIFHGRNFAVKGDNVWFAGGAIGVDFFFLVSGCMMAASAARRPAEASLGEDTFHFIRHKILGLCPNFFVGWGIGFIVCHLPWKSFGKAASDAAKGIWELMFLNQSGLMGYRVNHVTWYLSAMILAMILIYPLLRCYRKTFYYLICPALFIFLMGFTYQNFKSLFNPSYWNGWITKGLLRGIMDTLGGCLCYQFAEYLQKRTFTPFGRLCLSLAEWGIYAGIAVRYFSHDGSKYDWTAVFFFLIAISITVSQCSYDTAIFRCRLFPWLGEYSFSLFLGHGYWSHVLPDYMPASFSYPLRICIYVAISLLTGLFIMYFSKALKLLWQKKGTSIRHLFIAS